MMMVARTLYQETFNSMMLGFKKLFSLSALTLLGLVNVLNFSRYNSLVIDDAQFSAHTASYDSMCAGALGSDLVRINAMFIVRGYIGCSVHADRYVSMEIVLDMMGKKLDHFYLISCKYNVTKAADTVSGIAYDVFHYNGKVVNGTNFGLNGFSVPSVETASTLTDMCSTVGAIGEGMCYQIERSKPTLYQYFPYGVGLSLGLRGIHNVRCTILNVPTFDEIHFEAVVVDAAPAPTSPTIYARRITPPMAAATTSISNGSNQRRGRFRSPEAYNSCGSSGLSCGGRGD